MQQSDRAFANGRATDLCAVPHRPILTVMGLHFLLDFLVEHFYTRPGNSLSFSTDLNTKHRRNRL